MDGFMFKKIKKIILSYLNQVSRKKAEPNNIKHEDGIVDANFTAEDIPFELVNQPSAFDPDPQQKQAESPLKPYWKKFDNTYTEEYWLNKFKTEGRPFTPEQHREVFHKHISMRNFLGPGKRGYLYEMWKDAEYLKTVLEPLTKLGILYTLDLTGGSVRDFVLNNHEKIKDLDFMVSIQTHTVRFAELKTQFTEEQIAAVEWKENLEEDQSKVKLIELCFLAANQNIQVYDHVDKRKKLIGHDNYKGDIFKKDRLMAVFKIDAPNTYYPIDILLTDFSKPEFVDGFDYDICKASISFINPHVKKEFPKDFTHLISRFVADVEFWADVHNKTITYNATDRDTFHVDGSYDKHYPRIEKKYPDYRLLVVGDGEAKAYFESRILDKELAKKDDYPKKKTIKI
jgi:hypothetical protein